MVIYFYEKYYQSKLLTSSSFRLSLIEFEEFLSSVVCAHSHISPLQLAVFIRPTETKMNGEVEPQSVDEGLRTMAAQLLSVVQIVPLLICQGLCSFWFVSFSLLFKFLLLAGQCRSTLFEKNRCDDACLVAGFFEIPFKTTLHVFQRAWLIIPTSVLPHTDKKQGKQHIECGWRNVFQFAEFIFDCTKGSQKTYMTLCFCLCILVFLLI